MINDKNGSNQRKEYEYTETPFVAQTVPMKKSKPRKLPQYPHSLSQLNPKEYKSEEKGAHTSCKCPKSLGSLLSKLIAGIQDILPHIMDTKVIAHAPCGNNTKSVTVPPQNKTYRQNEKKRKPKTKTSPFKSQVYTAHPVRTYFDTERKSKRKFKVITSKNIASTFTTSGTISIETTTSSTTSTTTTSAAPRTTTTPRTTSSTTATTTTLTTPTMFTSTADFSTATIFDDQSISVEIKDSKKTVGHSTIPMPTKINITQPTLLPSEIINYDYNFIFKPDIRKKSTKMTNIRNPTTEIFIPMKFVDSSHENSTTKKLRETYTVSSHRPRVNVPLFKEEEYDDYFITTPSKSASELEILDVPNLKLIKNKMTTSYISPQPTTNINKMFVKLKSSSFHPVTKQPDLDFVSMRKMADLIYSPQEKTTKETKYTTEAKVSVPFHRKYTEPSLLTDSISTYSIDNHQNHGISPSTSSKDTKRMTNPVSDIKTYNNEDTKFNDDLHISEILLDDEFQEEYSFRQMDITTKDPNKYVNSPKGLNKTEDMNLEEMKTPNKWEVNKNEQTEKVILLIYEYAIAVEWSLVQNQQITNRSNATWKDQPFADRLDRSYFGLDQDYYERMPLLINALQESSYFDPTIETTGPFAKRRYNMTIIKPTTTKPTFKPSPVRRTSPRPFFFEYRSPTPLPFSKTYGSRSWIERYRNEERLKNIRQIIKYLETTINAKSGDLHSKPSSTHIAFTGVYIEPMLENKGVGTDPKSDLQQESSENINQFKSNHLADPLFNFKPESPGEVNLLADDFLRFAPIPTPSLDTTHNYPMFRQIPFNKRNCLGNKCEHNFPSSIEIKPTETPPLSTTKSFSVMLNLFPIKKEPTTTVKSLDNIYLTTSRPLIQFKRKSNVGFRRIFTPYKRPKYLSNLINKQNKIGKPKDNQNKETPTAEGTQMIVHVKVYSPDEKNDLKNETIRVHSTIPSTQTNPYTTKAPIELSTSQIEDHHVGSSGYIPVVEQKTEPTLPKVTTIPFFELTTEHLWPAPTEVFQFNAEDAKVPNQYLELERRNNNQPNIQISRRNSGGDISDQEELSTLIVKLKNEYVGTTTEAPTLQSTEKVDETTTEWTYVPQINGHYRNINQNLKKSDADLNANPENNRKKRLEQSVSGYRTYVPMYVEIKRNHSQTPTTDSEQIVDNKDSK
ncbi:unnamed protein product [Spodoptera exigua]|nr:unnamed protein product [Spodoptera exigua]